MSELFKGLFEHVRAKAAEGICSVCGRVSEENYHGDMICKFSGKKVEECTADPLPAFKKSVKEEANPSLDAAKKIAAKSDSMSGSRTSKEKSADKAADAKTDGVISKNVGADAKDIAHDDPSKIQNDKPQDSVAGGKADAAASAASSKSTISGEKSDAAKVNAAADKKNDAVMKEDHIKKEAEEEGETEKEEKAEHEKGEEKAEEGMDGYNESELKDYEEHLKAIPENVWAEMTEEKAIEIINMAEDKVTEEYMGFKKLSQKLSHKKGITDPKGLAAYIGRKKYGQKAFAKMGAAARKKG